jgi:hypothetical protein
MLTGLPHMRVATSAEGEAGTRGPAIGAKGQELGRAGLEGVGLELGFGSIRVSPFFYSFSFMLCFVFLLSLNPKIQNSNFKFTLWSSFLGLRVQFFTNYYYLYNIYFVCTFFFSFL